MRRILWAIALGMATVATSGAAELDAAKVLREMGARQGLCAIVGGDGQLALDLAKKSKLTIYLQVSSEKTAQQARDLAQKEGLLGSRVYVEKGSRERVHLADNLADAIVAMEEVPQSEALRVIHPRGKLITSGKAISKPVPPGIGEWSHPYHSPDNNPLSQDRMAQAPYLTQFLATPYYGPMPEVTVSSGGRLFKAFGHISFKEREWAMLSKLIAINAYNGTRLWERELTPGYMIHRNTMIATPDTLFLADNESCKLIDAATGKIRDEIAIPSGVAEGPGWKWMALKNGTLYALVGKKDLIDTVLRGKRKNAGWPWSGLGKAYAQKDYPWGFGKTLLAMDAKTKKIKWKRQFKEQLDSRALCMRGDKLYL